MKPAPDLPSVLCCTRQSDADLLAIQMAATRSPKPSYKPDYDSSARTAAVDFSANKSPDANLDETAISLLERSYTRLAKTHQQYIASQATALNQLLAAKAHFSGDTTLYNGEPESVGSATFAVNAQQPPTAQGLRSNPAVSGVDVSESDLLRTVKTDLTVTNDAWYLHHGHMPAGVMLETGLDYVKTLAKLNTATSSRPVDQPEEAFVQRPRHWTHELTFHQGLPTVSAHINYQIRTEISTDVKDTQSDSLSVNRMVVCDTNGKHYVELTSKRLASGQGYRSPEQEVVWDPNNNPPTAESGSVADLVRSSKQKFTPSDVQAFCKGELAQCFGQGFEAANCHQRTPTIVAGALTLFDRVSALDFSGGDWGRGYLRASLDLFSTGSSGSWLIEHCAGDEQHDPWPMLFEAGLQTMAFYLCSLGLTLSCDGWRFEPVKGKPFHLSCADNNYSRLLLISANKNTTTLTIELFVRSVQTGPNPMLCADLVCSVDGQNLLVGESIALELVRGWPLESRLHLLQADSRLSSPEAQASVQVACTDDFAYDEAALLASAWGRPSQANGTRFSHYDFAYNGTHFPGFPYHFISRVVSLSAEPLTRKEGTSAIIEYDVGQHDWYFDENSQATMPFSVLLEVALQACGWLSAYIGLSFHQGESFAIRNLDGKATQFGEIYPGSGKLTTKVCNTSISKVGSMTLIGFDVDVCQDDALIYGMRTVFGYFPFEALAEQNGLREEAGEREGLEEDMLDKPILRTKQHFYQTLRLPGPMLCLLDRVTGFWPEGGKDKLGRIRAEMDVDSRLWFFKAHFYTDPVQPGSLGLEMMLQCLQYFAIEENLAQEFTLARFASQALGIEHSWCYRGQVVPESKRVVCDVSLTSINRESTVESRRIVLQGDASLWVDGLKIYQARRLSIAILEAADSPSYPVGKLRSEAMEDVLLASDMRVDLAKDRWINDHCPTYTVPSLPIVSMLDMMVFGAAQRVPGKRIIGFRNIQAAKWLTFSKPRRYLKLWGNSRSHTSVDMTLLAWDDDAGSYDRIASGEILIAEQFEVSPQPWPPLVNTVKQPSPYETGELFHGPSFYALLHWEANDQGSTAWVDAAAHSVPVGSVNPGFLDAALHGICHNNLQRWFPQIPAQMAAYPLILLAGDFYRDIPRKGIFRVEVRARGLHSTWRSPQIGVQIIDKNEQVLVQSDVLFALMPKGPLGSVDALQRKRFIVDQTYFPDMRLSSLDEAQPPSSQLINLSAQTVDQSNWLPGTLERIFRLRAQDKQRKVAEIAIKEQIAAQLHVHPAFVNVAFSGDQANAVCSYAPLQRFDMSIQQKGEDVVIGPVATALHMEGVRTFWQNKLENTFGLQSASGFQIDVFYELTRRFVGKLRFDDPEFINRSNEKGCLFVANHQVAVESMTFSILLSAMQGKVINMIAKKEHKDSWMGKLLFILGERSSLFEGMLTLINREDSQDVFSKFSQALEQVRAGHCSMLVHVNGTRSLQAREPVSIASTALLGAAISAGVDIVPVSFRGGLPLLPLSKKLEFPIAYGKQDILVGKALAADQLSKLSAVEQKQVVLEAINGLQPALEKEMPGPSDSSFSDAVSQAMSRFDGNEVAAVLWVVLSSAEAHLSDETALILQMLELGGQPDEDQLENESIWQIAQEIFRARHKA